MSESASTQTGRLPFVFKLALCHFAFFALLCILLLFAAFYLPLGLLLLYPCFGFILSATIFLWSVIQLFFPSSNRNKAALGGAAIMSLTVPICVFFLGSTIANGAARIQAARTAPLPDFQAWAVKLIEVPSASPQDDFFWGGDTSVPSNLLPFTSHFHVIVRRPIGPGDEEAHVELIAGGGLSEIHSVLSIGQTSFVPHDGHSWWKWADGIYYTFP